MNIQELLIHSIFILLAALFAGHSHAQGITRTVPVVDAHNSILPDDNIPKQEYVAAKPQPQSQTNTANQELLGRIEALQDEVQKLRGKIEVQSHDLQVLRTQQQALYRDLDNRLAQGATAPQKPTVATQQKQHITDDKAEFGDNGDAFYHAAYQMLQNKEYPRAISAFQVFLKNYPKSNYASNAHYWLGELYLSQGFIDKAKGEFNTVINTYKKSAKVPAAMLKLGFAYYDNGEWQKARDTLKKVRQSYPDTDTAKMAATRISDMDQQGL